MYQWPAEVKEIIGSILYTKNPISEYEKYLFSPFISRINVILFDGNGNTDFEKVNNEIQINKYSIVNLGDYNKTILLDSKMWNSAKKELLIRHAPSINLDSNIISMLQKQFQSDQIIDQDFFDLLIHIKQNNLKLNSSPYLLEDSLNSSGMKNEEKAYLSLLRFFTFDRITLNDLHSLSFQSDIRDYTYSDAAWNQMKEMRLTQKEDEKRAKSIYCLLIKVFIIAFSTKESPKNKLAQLIDFTNKQLGVYFENGIILAYWYFDRSEECVTRFFAKIQPLAKEKLRKIEGMAWDLFHLWNLPTEMAMLSKKYNCLSLQSLATHDESLAQIAKRNPITRMAFYENEAQVKYKHSIVSIINDSNINSLLSENQTEREKICESVNLVKLAHGLEIELLNLFPE